MERNIAAAAVVSLKTLRPALALFAVLLLAAMPAIAGGWDTYDAAGAYTGRVEQRGDGTYDRYDASGAYQGRFAPRGGGSWDSYGPDGSYQGRMTGNGRGDDGQPWAP